jgi:very-short-patch-repair endonuclease/formylglycine-generating enzyme required for sulfatase activity
MARIPYIRVFISSPGDVNAERKIALDVIDYFPNRPSYREKVAFRVVAWDKPGAGTAMLGTLTPQEAINRGLPKPSECDIVIVIFWSRMGTHFTHTDGVEYQSGTHWELLDALNSKSTQTMIFRRTEERLFKSSEKKEQEQNDRVIEFFKSDLFYHPDGSIVRGVNQYATPDDFRRDFEIFFEEQVVRLLESYHKGEAEPPVPAAYTPPAHAENVTTVTAQVWHGSPFPGLRAFTEADAPIFFGRGRETDALMKQISSSRFVTVVGASGSGKSSLVRAGMIPRLKSNAIEGSANWLVARFTPGESPFVNMAEAIKEVLPSLRLADLLKAKADITSLIESALKDRPEYVQILLFIDQFEELFTLAKSDAVPFAAMLASASGCVRLRVVVTMRHDFYQNAVEIADLAELLRDGSFPLSAPRRDALRDMIERPAERAGLQMESGLVERILDDTDDKPGNLALMAYALDELYKLSGNGHITHADYDILGGVLGAIGTRAEQTYSALPGAGDEKAAWMQRVFHQLVAVDERGTATRRRVPAGLIAEDDYAWVDTFITARLLVSDGSPLPLERSGENPGMRAELEVAHEALFRSWERLKAWIAEAQEDLILLRQVRNAAHDWQTKGRPDFLLWPQERLVLVYAMLERLKPELNEVERDFIEPEQKRLLRELETLPHDETSHERRRDIGDRLAVIGDTRRGVGVKDGLPEIEWLLVNPGGEIEIKGKPFTVQPFYIARYLVTYEQYQAFMEAPGGFENDEWWDKMPDEYKRQKLENQKTKVKNAPRDSISWYQAVAFARWMDAKYRALGLFEGLAALSPASSQPSSLALLPGGEGSKDYRDMAAKVMVTIARDLRQRQTSAEELLWECLRDRRLSDLKFRRQHPVANTAFIVDFFCNEAKLVVEVDGEIHASQQQEDQQRQQALEDIGLTVIRFANDAIFNDLERVLIDIQHAAEFPLSLGRGGQGVRASESRDRQGMRASDWQIRLPTEWEWQWMAQGGAAMKAYPWGKWQVGYANTSEAGLSRTTAVGMYPHGAAECGALDVAGNLWEWCMNDHGNPEAVNGYCNGESKVLRCGSFSSSQSAAATSFRFDYDPFNRYFNLGLRLAVCPIGAL